MFLSHFFTLSLSEVSYAQGMNDLCSRFLEVLDSEVDTYWSFCCYMEKFSRDFCADGLHRKIGGFLRSENNCSCISMLQSTMIFVYINLKCIISLEMVIGNVYYYFYHSAIECIIRMVRRC